MSQWITRMALAILALGVMAIPLRAEDAEKAVEKPEEATKAVVTEETKPDAEIKTIAVVSLAGYDALYESLAKIAELAGAKDQFTAIVTMAGEIEGIDKSKPVGFVLQTNGKDFLPYGFFPIADLAKLEFPGIEELRDNYDEKTNVLTLSCGEEDDATIKLKLVEKDGWLFVYPEEMAVQLPSGDPTALLEGLNEEYLFGARVNGENIPSDLIDILLSQLRLKLSFAEPETVESLEGTLATLSDVLDSIQTVTGGWIIDREKGDMNFSLRYILREGSPFQETHRQNIDLKTKWNDLFSTEGTVFAMRDVSVIDSLMVKRLATQDDKFFDSLNKSLDDQIEDETDRAEAKAVIAKFREFYQEYAASGRSDCACWLPADGPFVFGATIASGEKLKDAIKMAYDYFAKTQADDMSELFKSIRVNESQFEDYTVSTLVISNESEDAAAIISAPALLLGVKDDALLFLFGFDKKKVSAQFKKIASAERTDQPLEQPLVYFSFQQIGALLKSIIPDEKQREALNFLEPVIKTLSEGSSDAIITVTDKVEENNASAMLSVKGEVFSLIGEVIRSVTASLSDEGDSESDSLDNGDDLFEDDNK